MDGGVGGGDWGSGMRQWIWNVHDGAAEGEEEERFICPGRRGEGVVRCEDQKQRREREKARRDVGSSTGSFLYITKTAREESHKWKTCTTRSDPVRSLFKKKGDVRRKKK